jgi:RNA polymerase sigma factor (sigma-70 family)
VTLLANDVDAIYRAHAPSLFRRARRLLGSEADAHEIVSQVFLSLCERPDQYAGRSTLATFLYRMTTNACLNQIRNQTRRERLLAREAVERTNESAKTAAPDRTVQLRRLLQRMPEPLVHVAVYYYLDELTQEEIAEIIGCSRRHVGNLLVRLGEWIRAEMEQA